MTTDPGGPLAYDLVIFDCDGVLVDSEPITTAVLAEHLTRIGLPVTEAEVEERYLGGTLKGVLADAEARMGHPAPDDFADGFYAACFAAFDERLEAVEGVAEAIDALGDAPTCVASSGPHPKMRRTLAKTGLWERFEGRIFSASEVEHGKPAPDLFLHAAASMGVAPARCAVIEDSPAGATAGVAAGMDVFAYAARTPRERLARAGVTVFDAMADLPGLLRR